MVGLVSSPEPLKLSQIVLGETYDVYGRGRVKNFLHGMNMMDVELRIDGTLVTFAKISNFSQTLDMRRGIFGGMFDYKSCVCVCVCVYTEKERGREREREIEKGRERERIIGELGKKT